MVTRNVCVFESPGARAGTSFTADAAADELDRSVCAVGVGISPLLHPPKRTTVTAPMIIPAGLMIEILDAIERPRADPAHDHDGGQKPGGDRPHQHPEAPTR